MLSPAAAWASAIDLINQFGGVSITDAGIVSSESQLVGFGGIRAPHGHALGSVSFSTGPLAKGNIWSGATFFSTGSRFLVTGVGNYGEPKGTIFGGSFIGPIFWRVVSHTGKYSYVFRLSGAVEGQLRNGRIVVAFTRQTIYAYQNQWFQDNQGGIRLGDTSFNVNIPEPGTLGLLGTGLIVIAGTMRRKLFGS